MKHPQNTHILFLHGFTSSAKSGKAIFLKEQCENLQDVRFTIFDFNPTPRDFEYLTITGMINRLRQFLIGTGSERIVVIASSLGGLVATMYAERFGGVDRMLLLAPALFYHPWGTTEEEITLWKKMQTAPVPHHGFQQEIPLRYTFHEDGLGYTTPAPPTAATTIIHGRQDQTVPIEHSRAYAAAYPEKVNLLEIDADHRLTDKNGLLREQTYAMLTD
ncbi:YqiA/YcfP family alpha/beta fold hydrolase [Desulfoplanes sp.]